MIFGIDGFEILIILMMASYVVSLLLRRGVLAMWVAMLGMLILIILPSCVMWFFVLVILSPLNWSDEVYYIIDFLIIVIANIYLFKYKHKYFLKDIYSEIKNKFLDTYSLSKLLRENDAAESLKLIHIKIVNETEKKFEYLLGVFVLWCIGYGILIVDGNSNHLLSIHFRFVDYLVGTLVAVILLILMLLLFSKYYESLMKSYFEDLMGLVSLIEFDKKKCVVLSSASCIQIFDRKIISGIDENKTNYYRFCCNKKNAEIYYHLHQKVDFRHYLHVVKSLLQYQTVERFISIVNESINTSKNEPIEK